MEKSDAKTELKHNVEAVLFASGKKISAEDIAKLCSAPEPSVKQTLAVLEKEYKDRNGPIALLNEGKHWHLTVWEKYLNVVHGINPHTELSRPMIETLAIIAWKHPLKQSDLIRIRGSGAYEHVHELMEMGFLSKKKVGNSSVLKVTQKFYDYFDLRGKEQIQEMFKKFTEPSQQKSIDDFETKLGKLTVYDHDHISAIPKPIPPSPIKVYIAGAEQKDDPVKTIYRKKTGHQHTAHHAAEETQKVARDDLPSPTTEKETVAPDANSDPEEEHDHHEEPRADVEEDEQPLPEHVEKDAEEEHDIPVLQPEIIPPRSGVMDKTATPVPPLKLDTNPQEKVNLGKQGKKEKGVVEVEEDAEVLNEVQSQKKLFKKKGIDNLLDL
ncbi:SMC-Scp complex subunit ScpB [Candidatus Woesearchaeota archaeon]|nr:SMC-Scp complex subunit ScpB [Candidatus Woesearchaeota archaeon]